MVFLLFCACIGWNSDQKEVVASYNALLENAEKENWHSMFMCLTEETQQLFDRIAVIYTDAGVPFNNDGEELLSALVSDTDLFLFSSTIVSVEFRNDKAYLVSGQGAGTASYTFVLERRQWKLDLVPLMTDFLAEAMAGTQNNGTEASTSAAPSTVTAGVGPCELTIRNGLEYLSFWNAFCSPSSSESWGEDWLGSNILSTESELKLMLDAGLYDIQLIDSEGGTYTVWEINLGPEGAMRRITASDRDDTI